MTRAERPLTFPKLSSEFWAYVQFFILGSLLLPGIVHWFGGGRELLPLYFFALVSGLTHGWKAGAIVGFASPLFSLIATQMPPPHILPVMWVKTVMLGVAAGMLAEVFPRRYLWLAGPLAVLCCQVFGSLLVMTWAPDKAWSDLRGGLPGLMLQVLAAPLIAYFWHKYKE